MEKEYKVSWVKVIIAILAVLIIVGVIYLGFFKKDKTTGLDANQVYIENIGLMKEAGFEYFKGSNLPSNVGDTKEISLREMIDAKLIVDFKDQNGKSCNLVDSYVRTTKTLDNEYAMKVNLVCDSKSDYIVTSIANNIVCKDCNTNNTVNTSTNDKNNSNSTGQVTNNYYYNDNNYNSNASSNNTGSTGKTMVQHVTNYNISYVNSCDCKTGSCNNCVSNVYYSVNFVTNGGEYVPRQVVKSGDTANYVASYRYGYEFMGWYTDSSLTRKFDFGTPINNTLFLYAKWQKIDNTTPSLKFTVSYDSNGGSYVPSETVEDGNAARRPNDPVRECYRFMGWYLNGVKYDFSKPVKGNITLEAKWEDDGSCHKNNYYVEFNSNGGSRVSGQTVQEGLKAVRPSNPTKACYDFVAWHINSLNGAVYNFNNPVYEDVYLVAEWKDNGSCREEYTVRFDSNGGSSIRNQYVMEGDRADYPSNPVRTGYTFLGWYYNNREFNFNTRIYQDYTLVAKWEKDTQKYNTYCQIKNETYYSISYVGGDQKTWNYDWTIRFDNIRNTNNLKITEVGYLNTLTDYNNAYNKVISNKGLSMVGGTGKYNVAVTSGSMLRTYSLKQTNFNKSLSTPYYSKGYWYTDAYVSIRNYNNLTKYYAPNLGSYIYFVPYYFKVKYTDNSSCVDDLASRASRYANYEVVDSYYR